MNSTAPTAPPTTAPRPDRARWLLGLLLDVGLAPITYYLLKLGGVADRTALLVGTVAVAVRIGYVAVRRRRFDVLSGFMLAVNLVSLLCSVLTGDPRLVLARDPIISATIGALFLATCASGRPAMFHVSKRMHPGGPRQWAVWDRLVRDEPRFRRPFQVTTLVWSVALLAEATARGLLIYRVPVSVAVGLSQAVEFAVVIPVLLWTIWYRRRAGTQRYLAAAS